MANGATKWGLRAGTLAAAAMLFCPGVQAQGDAAHIDLAVTYAAARTNHIVTQDGFWLQGGALDLHAPLSRGLGVVADVAGLQKQSNNPAFASLDMVVAVFGPRYTFAVPRGAHAGRVSVFGEALAGEANASTACSALAPVRSAWPRAPHAVQTHWPSRLGAAWT